MNERSWVTLMVVGVGVGGQVRQQFAINDHQNVNAAFLMATYGSPELAVSEQNVTLIWSFHRQVKTTNPAKCAG